MSINSTFTGGNMPLSSSMAFTVYNNTYWTETRSVGTREDSEGGSKEWRG